MKTKTFALTILGALVLIAVLLPTAPPGGQHIALAGGSAVTLLNAQTVSGAGLASISSAATPTEDSSGRWTFLYRCRDASGGGSARCGVHLEISLDGTNWTAFHRFGGGDEIFSYPTCGVCVLRAWADDLGADHKATLTVAASGGTAPYSPSYTPTATRTPTPTH